MFGSLIVAFNQALNMFIKQKKPTSTVHKILIACLWLCLSNIALALEPVTWRSLSGDEKATLAKFQQRWSSLSPEKQHQLQRNARRIQGMSSTEKQKIKSARDQFQDLTPEQRAKMRKEWKNLTPAQRKKLMKNR